MPRIYAKVSLVNPEPNVTWYRLETWCGGMKLHTVITNKRDDIEALSKAIQDALFDFVHEQNKSL